MIYILATTNTGREFATSDAINDMGGHAVVPRTIDEIRDKKTRKHIMAEMPALARYMFLAISADQWHQIKDGVMIRLPNGTRKRSPITKVDEILPKEWERVKDFFAEIEMDYQYRTALLDDEEWQAQHPGPRKYLAPYNVADKLHLLGGDLQARFVQSLGTVDAPMIEAEVMMFGREVKVKVEPDKVRKWAAE